MRRGLLGRLAPPTEEQLSHSRHEAGWYMQRYSESKCKWEDQYFFSEVEALQGDFEVLNWAVATQPTKTFYEVRRDLLSACACKHPQPKLHQ